MTRSIGALVVLVAVVLTVAAAPVGVATAASASPSADAPTPSVAAASVSGPVDAATQSTDGCSFPVTEEDATGTEVTLEEPPERVVVTAPSAAQTIWELGEQERVVGMPVTQFTAYLNGSENRTHVMDESGFAPDREQVVALEPDLVIVPGVTGQQAAQSLRDAGLTVYFQGQSGSLDDIRENVRTTGRLLGACDAANETVGWMDERLERVREAVGDEDRPLVYYWVGEGFTPPADSFQDDLLEVAGARNAGAQLEFAGDGSWQLADREQIVELDPEYLLLENGSQVPDSEAIQSTTAVQEGNVLYVNANYWNQNAPRVVLAVEQIAAQLHPGAAEAAGMSSNPAPGPVEESGSNAGGAIPGLGVGAALAALLALVAALAGRGD